MIKCLLQRPAAWLSSLICWFAVLWIASSTPGTGGGLPIPHFDKFLHFVFFFGGGLVFAGWRFQHQRAQPHWMRIVIGAVILMAAIGFMDEWHQCYTPNRNGGSAGDWIADVLGATAGALTLRALHRRL